MARKGRYYDDDDDDYEERRPRRSSASGPSVGAGLGIGALAGFVGGEGALLLGTLQFMKDLMGPAALLMGWAVCFLVFALAPVFVLLGMCGGVAAVKMRSTLLGIGIGALAGPLLVFVLWGCGAISIQVNNQPVKFNLNMALWCSALLWIPGAVGALFTGLLILGDKPAPDYDPPRRRRRRVEEKDDRDDDRGRRPRRDEDDDDRPRRERARDDEDEDERPRRRR